MKRIRMGLLWILALSVLLMLGACSRQGNENTDITATQQPENTAPATEVPSTEQPEDFSMTTTLPDGTQRIEARVLAILNDTTYQIKSLSGEQELKLSEKVSSHAKILGVKEQSKIIVTLKDGVADSIELVTSE